MQESDRTIERDYLTSILAICIYCIVGLLVWEILVGVQGEPSGKEGLSRTLDKLGNGFELMRSYVGVMVFIAIALSITTWLMKYNNLRDGFILCGLIALLVLTIV
ncbi:hypothetical protein [Putridiphycobacter roseus]|uniref:hypothetical protein n=1 Tax=Putridiphycobacter roseus TaxID=2219161 RepID=UPI0011B7EE6A|nr:hypothetical protein [Putridiphycobacter roseus]